MSAGSQGTPANTRRLAARVGGHVHGLSRCVGVGVGTCLAALLAILLAGCETPPSEAAASAESRRLKVGDLAAPQTQPLPSQVSLQVIVFEAPADKAAAVGEMFDVLRADPIFFADRATLEANDIRVRFGTQRDWPDLAKKLDEADAKQAYLHTLIHFDDRGLDLVDLPLWETQTLSYIRADGSTASVELEPGRLVWSTTAQPVEPLRGVADVVFRYVHRRQKDIAAARLARQDRVQERVFDFSVLSTKMSRGDFILMGPTTYHDADRQGLLDSAFMVPRSSGGVLRLYMVLCTKVGL